MDIYLLRHGNAVPVGSPGITSDDERTLSDQGRKDIRKVGCALRKLKLSPHIVLTSPLIRARETAEIVAKTLGDIPVTECDELGHGFSPSGLLARLRELPADTSAILVGHQPDLGTFTSFLVTGDADSVDVALKKGGVCRVAFDHAPAAGNGSLRWLLTQKHLSMMAS